MFIFAQDHDYPHSALEAEQSLYALRSVYHWNLQRADSQYY
ncbi:hypothetical protein XFF6992_710011 [Xanthomonas citri pv. fuscans]|nr:hypothetical protein XFF6992_190111 [Xanthomonas citri pv. fuscans]SOO18798.1 hypothetical protein XFF6992_260107 [Xanthomonas citri pv. fuscans]SOO21696.1 hypothetical protein XFF6992_710011 [Xanthomonas citri pv. fuscans]SOO30753.1 hypothetical protein XFF6994_1150006 [Xanthomonas citri pv. fuscans]